MENGIKELNGQIICLKMASFDYQDKEGSEFIYDESLKSWCFKPEYDKLDIEKDDISKLPMLQTNDLDRFGIWRVKE